MKMNWKKILIIIIVVGVTIFNVYALLRASQPAKVADAPSLADSPARIYGVIEPAGGMVYVSPTASRSVVEILVKEGQNVEQGTVLCRLDDAVEKAQLNVSTQRLRSTGKAVELSRDIFQRNKSLYQDGLISDFEYNQSRLKSELDAQNYATAVRESELARTQLNRLSLVAPISGKLYKFDVRLGETLTMGANDRIIMGGTDLWARMYSEAYWMDRIKLGVRYKLYDSETNTLLGEAEVIQKTPYVGSRNFRTEDPRDRSDNKYMEIVMRLISTKTDIPLGLTVVAELGVQE